MKKQILNTLKTVVGMIAVASLLTACGKDKGGSVAAAPNPALVPFEVCTDCPVNRELLGRVSGATAYGMTLNLDLYGDAMTAHSTAGYFGPEKFLITYNGAVAAGGQMQITAQTYVCNAYVVPGAFTVRTLRVGQMSGSMLSNLKLEVSKGNGERMTLNIASAMLTNPTDPNGLTRSSASNRIVQINSPVVVESVNGQPCPGGSFSLGALSM
jgi:hypothetical protein